MLEERAYNAVRAFPKMLDRQADKLMVRMDLLPTEKHGLPTHMQSEVSVQPLPDELRWLKWIGAQSRSRTAGVCS